MAKRKSELVSPWTNSAILFNGQRYRALLSRRTDTDHGHYGSGRIRIGDEINGLRIIGYFGNTKHHGVLFMCRCTSCGKQFVAKEADIENQVAECENCL